MAIYNGFTNEKCGFSTAMLEGKTGDDVSRLSLGCPWMVSVYPHMGADRKEAALGSADVFLQGFHGRYQSNIKLRVQ